MRKPCRRMAARIARSLSVMTIRGRAAVSCLVGVRRTTCPLKTLKPSRDGGGALMRAIGLNPRVRSVFDFACEDVTLAGYRAHPRMKASVAV